MATPEQFSKKMGQIAGRIEARSADAVRRAAVVADQVVTTTTPVDTGRARANWLASIGLTPREESEVDPPEQTGATAITKALAVIATYRTGRGTIFISNNVAYIQQLEAGSSAQAPGGMVRQAVQAAQAEARRTRLLK